MEWIAANAPALNLAVGPGTLAVWIVYLQLFVTTYRRARRPRVIINRGGGSDLGALCLVSNMSAEPIYPQSAKCTAHLPAGPVTETITDRELLSHSGDAAEAPGVTSHGPLERAGFISLGSFRKLLDITLAGRAETADDVEQAEIMVICAFGGDDLEIAATRAFRIDRRATPADVIPLTPFTRQIFSRRERRQIRQSLIEELRDGG
ncbi:hypothetical protein [Pseudoroseicyclus sp. CXY001]|uniref:hypothetical protein n=1 Tax=Pseudoroseicyclus sp. CXY001 TaxID=3242492 RepID=UPI00358DD00E